MNHEQYIRRCLQLARLGAGQVAPNPMVGSVIVHDGKIIGEGYHTAFGNPHAEVEAINSVKDKSLLKHSTLYVNLEPCSHFGKTPPCADRIIAEGIPAVVIAALDPNPLVAGRGVGLLKENGISVMTGVLEEEALELNKRFYCFHQKKRPYVILKWAETTNGFIGSREGGERLMISNKTSNMQVHKWRSEEQAILIGKNTAQKDNPRLNVRDYKGKNPVRFVIDANLDLDSSLHLFSDGIPTYVINRMKDCIDVNPRYICLQEINAASVLESLYKCNISSLIIEGGLKTHEMFIREGLWDEARIIKSDKLAEDGIPAPKIKGVVIENYMNDNDQVRIIRNVSGS